MTDWRCTNKINLIVFVLEISISKISISRLSAYLSLKELFKLKKKKKKETRVKQNTMRAEK